MGGVRYTKRHVSHAWLVPRAVCGCGRGGGGGRLIRSIDQHTPIGLFDETSTRDTSGNTSPRRTMRYKSIA